MKNNNLIIIYAIVLQAITGIFIFFSPEPLNIARLGIFYKLFGGNHIGTLLQITAVILAIYGLQQRSSGRFNILLFFPQQFFLLLTAGSAIQYVVEGHYADGVVRSWQFIFLDQLPSLIAAILYLIAISQKNPVRQGDK